MKTALTLTAILFLGIALGFVVGRRDGGVAPADAPGASSETPVAERPDPPPPVDPTPKTPPPPPAVPDGARSDLRAALEAIAAIPPESGRSSFSGHVRDKSGAPVSGVQIRILRSSGGNRQLFEAPDSDAPLEELVVDFVRRKKLERDSTRETSTNEDGAYEVSGLAESVYYDVLPKKPGWSFSNAPDHHSHEERPGQTVDFVATQRVELPIEIVHSDGTEPARANISWHEQGDDSSSRRFRWTPDSRRIGMEPGTYVLEATAGDQNEFASAAQTVTLAVDTSLPTLRFVLKSRPGVRGRVVFPAGEKARNAVVGLVRSSGSDEADARRLSQNEGKTDWVHEGSGYRFSFLDVAPGTYLVAAKRNHNSRALVTQLVEVKDEGVEVDLEVPSLADEEHFTLWVRDPDGELTQEVTVGATYEHGRGSRGQGTTAIHRDDGSIWIARELPADVEENDLKAIVFRVEAKKLGKHEIRWEPGDGTEFEIEFERPATLEITVRGYAGSGYEGRLSLSVELGADDGSRRMRWQSPREEGIDAEGRQSFGPLAPGDYLVNLQLKTGSSRARPISESNVTISPGENTVEVDIPELYTLTVHAPDVEDGQELWVRPPGRGSASFSSMNRQKAKDGRVVFADLAPGDYKISAQGGGMMGEMSVRIPQQLEVDYEPVEPNALSVTVSDPDGVLAQAGFETGDVIVGIGGTQFEGMAAMMLAVQAAMIAGKKVTFDVARGRSKLQIEIDPKKLQDSGGNIEPTRR